MAKAPAELTSAETPYIWAGVYEEAPNVLTVEVCVGQELEDSIELELDYAAAETLYRSVQLAVKQLRWRHCTWFCATLPLQKNHIMHKNVLDPLGVPLCGKNLIPFSDGWQLSPILDKPTKQNACLTCLNLWQNANS